MKIATFAMLLAGILSVTHEDLLAQSKASLGTITLLTYEEGPPDPNPPFDTYADTEFNYPYTMRTSLTGVKHDHAWRAVFLENEYLKCTILPDLGGHLYTCIDKIDGQPMFYANPSIKKAEIGHRGAWAAFGLEYNFPVSHNWASLSPVDFAYKNVPDGSASVTVGNIDRVYGMQWSVELVLKPGSTLLEEHVTLFNRSDVRHRYYWWDNAGVQVWDDSRVQYPMRFAASHGFTDVYGWPVLKPGGKDLSLISNHTDGPVSYFSHGSHETFMGVWHPKTNAGIAQFSEYRDLPAKKIWSWGSDADGLAWREALSDNHSTYVEVQAGLFRNQETYAFLDPGQTIRFSEAWMPVRGTGGISRANKAGALHLEVKETQAFATLDVNEHITGAQLSLSQNGVSLWNGSADLAPEHVWSHSVTLKDPTVKVTFELKDHAGVLLMSQTDGEYDWDPGATIKTGPQQAYQMPGPAARSEDDWLQLGADQEVNGMVVLAMTTYKNGLEKYPASLSLQIAAGRVAASLQRYDEAAVLLRAAHLRDTPNAVIAYYLGIAEEGLGRTREAETAYDIAYRQAFLRAPAAIKLGELQARQGHLQSATAYLQAAVDTAPESFLAKEELEAVTRFTGDTAKGNDLAHVALAVDPTSDFLKEELSTPDLTHLAADPYRVLRVATEYMQLGLYRQAFAVLSRTYPTVPEDQAEPGSVLPQNHPLVIYYAAFCKDKLREKATNWQTASQLSPALVFPSTDMDRMVLEQAILANGKDGTAHYLLGTLLFSKGFYDAGMQKWTEAKRLSPGLRVVDLDLGKAQLELKNDPQQALASFRNGVQVDPDNPEIYIGLDQTMSLNGVAAKERAATLSRYPHADAPDSKMPAKLVYQLALTRAEAGDFEPALSLFKDRFLPSQEGAVTTAQVLFEIKLMQAEAEAKTEHCGAAYHAIAGEVAKATSSSAQIYFRTAQVLRACGDSQQANEFLNKAAKGSSRTDLSWAVQAAKALGTDNADESTEALRKAMPTPDHLTEIGSYSSLRWYTIGLTQAALHQTAAARESFRKSLLLPDNFMSHHLTRAALVALPSY